MIIIQFNFADASMSDEINRLLADTSLAGASIGVKIYDITLDSVIYAHGSDKLLIPASNLKLFTSAAALQILGPSFRFKTSFFINGVTDEQGKFQGDLDVVGGGDPLISGRFRSSVTEILEFWADSLKSKGIKEIDGKLVARNKLYASPELGPGWSWDDLSYWYACPVSALSFNDNCVDLEFFPGNMVGDSARIAINPSTKYITIRNNATTVAAESSFTLDYYRTPNTNDITFFGGIPISDSAGRTDYVSVNHPELYTLSIFSDILKAKGINVVGGIDTVGLIMHLRGGRVKSPLFEWQSDSLPVVLKVINTNSQNFFAEQTLRMLGVKKEGDGSFKGGVKAVMGYLDSIGISNRDIVMYDGSGLSYMNIVKPDAIVTLLSAVSHSPNFKIYYESLANPEKDRAFKNRLKGIPNRSNIRVKGGNIANVSTLAGYIKGPKNAHLMAFSIMINNYTCSKSYAEAWEDSLVATILSEY